jgi:hypothetical protein
MKLLLARIPPELHHLVGLAEKYGVADDWMREDLVRSASSEEKRALKSAVYVCDDAFDVWLAGPDLAGPDYSDEYIAFSALRLAADSV